MGIKNRMINIRISNELYKEFSVFCKKNGFSLSKRIRVLLENDIKNERNIKHID